MTDTSRDLQAQLASMTPEMRARVEQTLKEAIDKELVTEQGRAAGGIGPKAQFSRGILFSKSGASMTNLEEIVLPALSDMDDEKFKRFMDRIAVLKARNPGGTP